MDTPVARNSLLTLVALLALALGPLSAATEAPSADEWAPVAAAIEAGDADARERLAGLLADRDWAAGWVQLAELDRRAGDLEAAFRHARRAFQSLIDADESDADHRALRATAAAIAIEVADRLDRYPVCRKVFASFGDLADPHGQVHLRMAWAALEDDPALSRRLLTEARTAAGPRAADDPAFALLAARQAEHAAAEARTEADAVAALDRAAEAYRTALAARAIGEIHYNLGRVLRRLAQLAPDRADALYAEATTQFAAALDARSDDADARFELGLVLLAQGDPDAAYNALHHAIRLYQAREEDQRPWMLAAAYRARGAAQLHLAARDPAHWDRREALADLEKARALGDRTADLYNNLLVAYLALDGEAGDFRAEIDALMAEHSDTIAPVNLALSLLTHARATPATAAAPALLGAAGTANQAAELFGNELGIDLDDPEAWADDERERAPLWRYLGHARATQAQRLAAADEAEAAEAMRRQAYAAWRIAGGHGDGVAQDHYLALASRDDPAVAYAAGWQILSWYDYISLPGWRLVLGNYAASDRWQDPIHLGFWILVPTLFLILALRARYAGAAAVLPDRTPPPARPRPPERPAAAAKKPAEDRFMHSTLRPDSYVAQPSSGKGTPALEARAANRKPDSGGGIGSEETAAYTPEQARARQARRSAANDVARRLAREQGQRGDGGSGRR